MADNLIFPIQFDLEKAVNDAGQQWDKKYAKKLEDYINKRPIKVKLDFESLTDVKTRLAQLKIEPITPETKAAIKELASELRTLAKALEQVQKYSKNPAQLGQQNFRNDVQLEKLRQANERLEVSKRRVALAEQKHAEALSSTSKKINEQHSYVSRLIKRMAVYASFSYAGNFLTSIREVTAQFELQRVSLGAIIQDQARANELFSEIKSFALKSPVKILDLTKYTKQLAAYKIGVDELFDTTKRLTDISVGLGVSMDRVVLAYGQVRARGALYSSEIRQFTEMGVPIVEELAAKLSKVNGELVTSKDVLKLVEKGAISFELVKEVFDDMTSAGGAFYNMQEKQGNTLFGLWAKLGDAASVMYDEIGNTSFVNGQMKGAIAILTDLMKNWRYVANAMMMAVPTMLLVHNIEKSRAATSARQIAAMNTLTAATSKRMVAEKALNQAIASGLANTAAKARMNLILAQTEEKVAQKALTAGNNLGLLGKRFNLFGGALKSLSAFVATNFWTILLTGIALLTSATVSANEKANRLKNTLAEIGASGSLELSQSVQNFERLAKIVVESADGSKKQRDALDELHRIYKEMIPVQDMTIEKLRAMNGDYRKLTIAIEEYIRARLKQQQIDAVTSEIGADLAKYERKMTEDAQGFFYTYDKGATKLKLTYDQIQLLIKGIKEIAKTERDLPARKVFAKALTDYVGLDAKNLEVGLDEWLNTFDDGLFGIVRSVRQFEGEIDRIKANETLDTTLGKYAESWKKVNERIENLTVKGAKVGTFTFDRATANASVKQYVSYLKEVLGNAWDESFASIEEHVGANGENMSAIYWEAVMKNWDTYTVAQQNAILKVQKAYDGLLPSDRTVVILREKLQQISGQFGVNMDITKQYLMNAGEDIETYAKRVKTSLEEAQNNLKELRFNKSQIDAGVGTGVLKPVSDEEIEKADNLTKVLAALFELISAFTKGGSGSTRTESDNRLQNLQEIEQTLTKINQKYDELAKKEGQTKALEDVNNLYANTLQYINKLGKQFKLSFKMPTEFKDLQDYRKAILDVINTLKMKGYQKAALDLEEKIGTGNLDALQKDIETQLKELSDRISRTKTAKEFYEKILRLTRNEGLAFQATFSVYGKDTLDTFTDEVEQLKQNFGEIDITAAINLKTKQIDYKKLRDIWDADKALPDNLRKIPQAYDSAIKSILDAGDKLSERQLERWGKDLERAREYADKRIELAQYTATQIAEIEAKRGSLDPESKNYAAQVAMYDKMISGYREREKNEAAKLDYEQIKEQIGMFDDLGVRIGTAFESILNGLREYTQSPDFARLGLEAQKNVYQQIAKIEDRMAEGFQGIGVGTVSEYVRQYSTAASEYLTAQNNLRDATLRAIEADKEWERVKNSNDEAAKSAALAEKTLADSRVRTAAASVNAAGANMQRAQEGAARASAKFDSNLQKVESSLKALNNGALKALWDLIGDKGKRSVGEFLSGSRKILSALDKLTKALADSGSDMGQLSTTIATNLAAALQNINPDDTEAIARAATESLKTTLSSVISDKGVVDLLANTLSKNIGEIASQALSGVLSTEDAANKVGALIDGVADAASKTGEMWGAIISLVLSLLDEFAENGIGTFLGELLDNIADAVEGILANLLTDSLPKILGSVGNVVKGVGVGLADMLTFGVFDLTGAKRIKRANKEIKRQQQLLEQLEYTYGRLEKAADKVFGADYVANQKQRQKILLAQQQAYMKQYEAEMSKGKKADEEKAQEFLDKARDIGDQIADMQGKIAEQMLGTDLTSAARDFAKAWLDAYKQFGNTADAMSEKFHEMIENMIVESLMAKAMQRALEPAFKMIDEMDEGDFYSEDFWRKVMETADQGSKDANAAGAVIMEWAKKWGYDGREKAEGFTGIAKSVAGATSEEINNVAAIGNTLMYYVSPIPRIDENLARVVAIMEGRGASAIPQTTTAGWTDWQQQAMDNYIAIQRNTADTVVECRRAAEACERIASTFKVKGSTKGLNVFLNS